MLKQQQECQQGGLAERDQLRRQGVGGVNVSSDVRDMGWRLTG